MMGPYKWGRWKWIVDDKWMAAGAADEDRGDEVGNQALGEKTLSYTS